MRSFPRRGLGLVGFAVALSVTAACGVTPSDPQPSPTAQPSPVDRSEPTERASSPTPTTKPSNGTSKTPRPVKGRHPRKPVPDKTGTGNDPRPNFVLITTDDMRADDLPFMPFTRSLLGGHGVTFTDALSPHPLCCPARAELMTGQYGQNSGVTHNDGATGGYPALKEPENTIAAWLSADGYRTAMSGKYLNEYKPKHGLQAGWTHWNPSIRGMYSYTDTTFFNDGHPQRQRRHVDDVIVDYTNDFIREFSATGDPFFVWASALAPHVVVRGPQRHYALPAPRHAGMFAQLTNPARHNPSYATPIIDGPPVGDLTKLSVMDHKYRSGIEALQAVDEGVKSIVETLAATGELDNTYIIFASDNGLHLGEHGLNAKNTIYEEAVRVPLLVRTPTAKSAQTSTVPVTLVDIPATILDLAATEPGRVLDGATFAPTLLGLAQDWRDTQLIQTGTDIQTSDQPGWEVRGVRTARWTYGENVLTGMVELYDRKRDPHELVNLAYQSAHRQIVTDLAERLDDLAVCSGEDCRRSYDESPLAP